MSLIIASTAISGRSSIETDANSLSRTLGLDKRIQDEKQKLKALTNPEAYIETRLAEELKVKETAFTTYTNLYNRYLGMQLPLEVCDLRARRGAAAIAQVELAAISEQFPSISARSIVKADSGKALRNVRKSRARESKVNAQMGREDRRLAAPDSSI